MKNCPDCVPVGEKHKDGCDVERCPHCGGQALGCVGFDPNDPRREPWTGEADCERLGFFVNGDRSLPELNRLFAECRWNPEQQRWEHDPAPQAAARFANCSPRLMAGSQKGSTRSI